MPLTIYRYISGSKPNKYRLVLTQEEMKQAGKLKVRYNIEQTQLVIESEDYDIISRVRKALITPTPWWQLW